MASNSFLRYLYLVLSVLMVFVYTSCGSIRSNVTRSRTNRYYESFYIGAAEIQYFIKPLEFVSTQNKDEKLSIDFTLKDIQKKSANDSVTINTSIFTKHIHHGIARLHIISNQNSFGTKNSTPLFKEMNDGLFHERYSSKISKAEFLVLFQDLKWIISATDKNGKEYYFSPTRKSQKALNSIHDNLIIIIQ